MESDNGGKSINIYDGMKAIRIPVANTYDVETDFTHLVNEALPLDERPVLAAGKKVDGLPTIQRRCQSARPVRNTSKSTLHIPVVSLIEGGGQTPERSYGWTHPSFDAIKAVSKANHADEIRPRKKVLNATYLTFAMDANQTPTTSNYMKRNQTTHQWTQVGGSKSFPNSPNRSMSASFEPRPAGIKYQQSNRPQSAYTYGGGIFVEKPKREYFVIHPEWVSESMTIQKLSLNDRQARPRTASARPSKRCRSAPPPKYRNPITWEKSAD